jgi:hypothetical protein
MKQLKNFVCGDFSGNASEALQQSPELMGAMQKYAGLDENGLMNALLNQIRAAAQNGTYNAAQMQNYVAMLSPHLTDAQREKLRNVMTIVEDEING